MRRFVQLVAGPDERKPFGAFQEFEEFEVVVPRHAVDAIWLEIESRSGSLEPAIARWKCAWLAADEVWQPTKLGELGFDFIVQLFALAQWIIGHSGTVYIMNRRHAVAPWNLTQSEKVTTEPIEIMHMIRKGQSRSTGKFTHIRIL